MANGILPDSRLKAPKAGAPDDPLWGQSVRIFCANCGHDGGFVPRHQFTFYLCQPCAETYGDIPGTLQLPEARWGEIVVDAMMNAYGRLLSPLEVHHQLHDPDSLMSMLARSQQALTPTGDT